jgi:LytS/YehU family sensor histidine kinase
VFADVPVGGLVEEIGIAALLQGSGTALILAVVGRVRERERLTRALALAEIRVQQRRMDPHFLFNALNTVAALAIVAPRKVPQATGRLREFLRASFAQEERALVPLEEELALIRAYLEIELLRFGEQLNVDETIDPGLLQALIPPFSFQPLVENAVQHGLRSSAGAGLLRISVRSIGPWIEMSVSDNGQGVPSMEIEQAFFADWQLPVHALTLLRRRLQGLFGCSFQLEAHSAVGAGTTVIMRIPLQTGSKLPVVGKILEPAFLKQQAVAQESETISQELGADSRALIYESSSEELFK